MFKLGHEVIFKLSLFQVGFWKVMGQHFFSSLFWLSITFFAIFDIFSENIELCG
jgi:hypothetical protein